MFIHGFNTKIRYKRFCSTTDYPLWKYTVFIDMVMCPHVGQSRLLHHMKTQNFYGKGQHNIRAYPAMVQWGLHHVSKRKITQCYANWPKIAPPLVNSINEYNLYIKKIITQMHA